MAKKDVFAPVDTDHPAFRSWFGKSVLHDNGVPRTYYHGTSKDTDFKKFKMPRHGIWMTSDPEHASMYAEQNDSQDYRFDGSKVKKINTASRVIPIYARIENPYTGPRPEKITMAENYKKANSDWFDTLRAQGYDGWVPENMNGTLAVALGHPGQVKSALSNTGDYSETGDINKAEGGSVDDYIPDIKNPVSVFPKPQRMYPEDARIPGGQYLNAKTKEDMTGHKAAMASIGVHPGGKPYFNASEDAVDETGTPGRGSAMAKTNLFKQKAGWKWLKAPEGHDDTHTIVSVEHRGEHHYALNAHFPKGVDLARYENASSEPRLRPTTKGNMFKGNQIGSISVRGKEHPVYDHVIVKAAGGSVDEGEDEGITAYHGSPYDFPKFDISKIGAGEGAQAYGHGLYFAESEPVAKGYRDRLQQEYAYVDGEKIPHPSEENPESDVVYKLANQLYQMGWNTDQAIEFANKHAESLKEDLASENFYKKGKAEHAQKWAQDIAPFKGKKVEWKTDPGHMYEVRINAHPSQFLDWDAPLRDQPEAIRRLAGWDIESEKSYRSWWAKDNQDLMADLEGTGSYTPTKPPPRPSGSLPMSMKGSDLYEHLQNKMGATDWPPDADADTRAQFRGSSAQRVSQYLSDNGIRGIKYLDAGSRSSGEGSRNYVVFNHDHVDIKRKYARGGAVDVG